MNLDSKTIKKEIEKDILKESEKTNQFNKSYEKYYKERSSLSDSFIRSGLGHYAKLFFLLLYNVVFITYFIFGIVRNRGDIVGSGFTGLAFEIAFGYIIFRYYKRKDGKFSFREVFFKNQYQSKRSQPINQKSIRSKYSPTWFHISIFCDNLIIIYKWLLVLALNGMIIFFFVLTIQFEIRYPYHFEPVYLVISLLTLLAEGFFIFNGYKNQYLRVNTNLFLNYFILAGTYITLFTLFMIGVTSKDSFEFYNYIYGGFFGLIIISLILFGKYNRFAVIYNLKEPKKKVIVEYKKKDTPKTQEINQTKITSSNLHDFSSLKNHILPPKESIFKNIKHKIPNKILLVMTIIFSILIQLLIIFFTIISFFWWVWDNDLVYFFITFPGFLIIIGEIILIWKYNRIYKRIRLYITKICLKISLNAGEKSKKLEKDESFVHSRMKLKKSMRYFNIAKKITPEIIQTVFISKIVLMIKRKIGSSYLSEGIIYSKAAWDNFRGKKYKVAVKKYNKANQSIEQAITYLDKQERKDPKFGFTVQVSLLYDILKLFKMIIPQIEMEWKYNKHSNLYQTNLDLQEIFDQISGSAQEINETLGIFTQTYIIQEKYYDKEEVDRLLDTKLTESIQLFENLQDRVSYLLQYIQSLEDGKTDIDTQFPALSMNMQTPTYTPTIEKSVTTVEASAKPTQKKQDLIKIIREYEYIGGKIRFKIGLVNSSGKVITNLALRFDLPDSLKWIIHEPDYTRRGDTILIPKLGGDEKIAISLYLEPLNCLQSAINATLTFFDAQDHPQAIVMPPKKVSITCPIFFTREEANIARVKSLQQKLKYNDKKIFPLGSSGNMEMIFSILLDTIGKHDVKLVDKTYSKDKDMGEAWYYGITKVKKQKMIIRLLMEPKKHFLQVNVHGDNQESITGLLAELEGQIREKLLMNKIISDKNTFTDISTSVLLGHCPYCNGPIAPEWISLYKKGEHIACKYCDTSIVPY